VGKKPGGVRSNWKMSPGMLTIQIERSEKRKANITGFGQTKSKKKSGKLQKKTGEPS